MNEKPRRGRYLYGLEIAYDGSEFVGWQRQAVGRSVQGELEKAVAILLKREYVPVVAASRTDSGVHAEGQFAVFWSDEESLVQQQERVLRSLNGLTDHCISVSRIVSLPPEFRLHTDVKGKIYRYQIWNALVPDCFLRRFSYHIRKRLDWETVSQVLDVCVGRHDFKAFSASACHGKDTVRTLFRVWLETEKDGRLVLIRFHGAGFLQHMVRIMVGTLLGVGRGEFSASDLRRILESADRGQAGATAPAHGLFLERVIIE